MPRIIICKDCGRERPHYAKSLCKSCYKRKWRSENLEKQRGYNNTEKAKESRHKWKENNLECYQKAQYMWRVENSEYFREYHRRWQANNPGYYRQYKQQRRARINNLPSTLTEQDWQEILDCWNYQCAYCGEHAFNLQQEHITPVCQGGGYTIENIVPACGSCNSKKGGRTPIEAGMNFYYQRQMYLNAI